LGTKIETKLVILAVLFLVTTILVHGRGSEPATVHGKPSLQDYFQNLAGYKASRDIALTDAATKMLKLDDYAFIDYEGRKGGINLYIGYYYTANKLSASHSPLVCYPTQGWKIDNKPERRTLVVGQYSLNYEAIVTSYSGQKELVLYWNQTYAWTSNQAYQHKINLAYNKLMKTGEQHAFVRVTVPFANSSQDEAEKAGADFIRIFFPRLIEYFSETGPAQAQSSLFLPQLRPLQLPE